MDKRGKAVIPAQNCEKLGMTSLSAVVQWVSCRTMMKALFLSASCSMTEIFVCSQPLCVQQEYVGSWVFGSISDTPPCEGRFVTHLCRTHPARIAVVALALAGLVDICRHRTC